MSTDEPDVLSVGTIVHVRLMGACYAAIVLDPGPRLSRLRVLVPSVTGVGSADIEGDYRNEVHPVVVPNPDGSTRTLAGWHHRWDCGRIRQAAKAVERDGS